ncbi:XRE family transcriptional regulator [Brevibacillus laterosporus]|uniref:XRE family transcriptional regulator n=1 Tax=Brevibacillus laterosporus TaxID=1465 RepID=A0A502H580_BRELA|nr:helix-turn-helix transcriptional regulator [Brevibacillus laterosporus]QDX95349.1 XRE family transcriptional regulator [Brevibacillus laterosporus]TPG69254.1 XRE family transcriptional regulator [Brevibacillus laterosporus]TPG86796.1 XRE family transcriptional regulator [Brevibacillus laterosporus]
MEGTALQNEALGEGMRRRRKDRNLSLSQLSRMTGISKGVISKIECGETRKPEWRTIKPIAISLQIPWEEVISYYADVERRSKILLDLLSKSISLKHTSLIKKVALRFVQLPTEDSYVLMEQLYERSGQVDDLPIRFTLFNVIVSYARERGMQKYLAKGLLQIYLVQRQDLKQLEESFQIGEEVLHYINFLTQEERIDFLYKLALQAYALKKYEKCIAFSKEGIREDQGSSEFKARGYLAMINSLSRLGRYEAVEHHLEQFQQLPYSFVTEATVLTKAILHARRQEYQLAIPLLKQCLVTSSPSSKIHVVNELLDIFLTTNNVEACDELFHQEKEWLYMNLQTPYKHLSVGKYYRFKGFHQIKIGHVDAGLESYSKSLLVYAKLNAFYEMNECINDILTHFATCSKAITVKQIEQLQRVYQQIISENYQIRGA